MTKKERVIAVAFDEKLVFADGFDKAIIGLDTNDYRVVYSKMKMVEILEKQMDFEDALEYLENNTWIINYGLKTPIYVDDF
jgi:hypothetical protein